MLALCAEAGLVRVGVIAVDGTKMHANASERATRSYEQIAREILDDAAAVDAEEDERFGDARGDELPSELATGQGRQRWLRDAKRRLDERRAAEAKPIPKSRPDRLKEAKRRLEEEHQVECRANEAYEDYRRHGRMRNGRRLGAHSPPKPYQPPGEPEGKINLTDPDSRNVKTPRGWVQGYNAQAVTHRGSDRHRRRGPRLLGRLRPARADDHRGPPRARASRRRAGARGRARRRRLLAPGPDGALGRRGVDGARSARRQQARAAHGRAGTAGSTRSCVASWPPTRAARSTPSARAMIEPVFADTKFNRGIDRFLRRGRAAARSEWRLTNAAHNLLKLWRHTTAPMPA